MPTCGNYKLKRKLGEGGSGEVYLAKHLETSQKVALKIIKSETLDQRYFNYVEKEVLLMKYINHSNIIRFFEGGNWQLSSNERTNDVF